MRLYYLVRRRRVRCCRYRCTSKTGAASLSVARHRWFSAVHNNARMALDDGIRTVRRQPTITITTTTTTTTTTTKTVSTTAAAVLHGDRFGRCVHDWVLTVCVAAASGPVFVSIPLPRARDFRKYAVRWRRGPAPGFGVFFFFFISYFFFSPRRRVVVFQPGEPSPPTRRSAFCAVHEPCTVYRNTIRVNAAA